MKTYTYLFILLIIASSCKKLPNPGNKLVAKPDTGWHAIAPFPVQRAYGTGFTLNNKGYVCGGVIDFTQSYGPDNKYMYMYDPEKDNWTKKAGLPPQYYNDTVRRSPFSFMLNGKAYAGGGIALNGSPEHDVEVYDDIANSWTSVGPANPAYQFSFCAGAAYNNKGYIFTADALWEFDPAQHTVVKSPVTSQISILNFNDWAGSTATGLFYGSYYSYAFFINIDPAANTFTPYLAGVYYQGIPLNQVATAQGINYKNSMYVCFGNGGWLYRFNFNVNKWQIVSQVDLGVTEGVTTFLIGSKFYMVGGNKGTFSPSTNKAWVIDLDAYPEN
jgi:hypothetical protein